MIILKRFILISIIILIVFLFSSCLALLDPNCCLKISSIGQGTVQINPVKEEFVNGEEVYLNAIPNTGWRFYQWDGDLVGKCNPVSIIMDKNKNIEAIFIENILPIINKLSGPSGEVTENTQTFRWDSYDIDGYIAGIMIRKDESTWNWITENQYTWTDIDEGPHKFEVMVNDDSGSYSEIVEWSFILVNQK